MDFGVFCYWLCHRFSCVTMFKWEEILYAFISNITYLCKNFNLI